MNIEPKLAELVGAIPPEVDRGVALGTGLADGYQVYEAAIGDVVVTFNEAGVSSVDVVDGFEGRFVDRFGRQLIRAEAPRDWAEYIPEALERGTPGKLPIDYRAVTEFQRLVLQETARIPLGEVRPYGWIAKEIDRPKAVRAVGTALARNPVPLVVPCHRVVRSDGHIGNYSLGGRRNKVTLLKTEGVVVEDLRL